MATLSNDTALLAASRRADPCALCLRSVEEGAMAGELPAATPGVLGDAGAGEKC